MSALAVMVLGFAVLAANDHASRQHCPVCRRPYAVFAITGRLNRKVLVCWDCFRVHRRRERRRAE